jgi:hypothetical protein
MLREEGLYCFMNLTYNANQTQINFIIDMGIVEIFAAQI